jgi:WD40 repeat protein
MIVNDCKNGGTKLIVALGLANNACEVWVLHRPTHELTYDANRHRRIIGMSRSITYSMCFFGWSAAFDDLILASGTVTNEILVWTPVDTEDTKSFLSCIPCAQSDKVLCTTVRQPEMHRLRGHEGVIHSVKFDSSGEFLASTSDDRSVRLWKRTTADGWFLMWSGWSHTARVWNVAFSPLGLISCGEDATAKIWDLDNGYLLGELHVHNCQCLWSIDVRDTLALIGCNDGSTKLWDLRRKIVRKIDEKNLVQRAERETTMTTFLVPDDRRPTNPTDNAPTMVPPFAKNDVEKRSDPLVENMPSPRKKKAKVKVKAQTIFGVQFYKDLDIRRKLLVPTRSGSLFSLCFESGSWEELEPWCVSSSSISSVEGSCLAVHMTGSLAAVGTTRGDILLVTLSPCDDATCDRELRAVRRIVCQARPYLSINRIAWLDDNTLISFHIKGIIRVWTFPSLADGGIFDDSANAPHLVLNTTLGELPTCFAHRKTDNRLFVGDSRGSIATFLLDNASHEHELIPANLARGVHKKEHVTDIMCIRNGRILSVGNDGCIRYSLINDCGEFETILSVPLTTLPGMSHIYLAEQTNGEETIIVAGYRGNTFLVLDVSSGYELFRIDTGGRQRAHTCFLDLNNSLHSFPAAYGIAIGVSRTDGRNEIHLQSFVSKSSTSEKEPATVNVDYSVGARLHGEPIFDLCIFATRPQVDYSALLSGSEDCTARVSIVRNSSIIHSELLPPQSSCIRAVCSSRYHCGKTTLLVVCGGKMTVHFYALTDDNTQSPMGSIADTAIMDDIAIRFLGTGYFPSKPSLDHRVNAVHAVPSEICDNASHFVATGDSDGSIYLFMVSTERSKHPFSGRLLCSLARPILSIEVILLRASSHIFIVAGATDGSILMWLLPMEDYSLPLSPLGEYKAHQMGTNSISVCVTEDGENRAGLRIFSGGDDQSVAISGIEVFLCRENDISSPSLNVASFARIDVASASGIKGVRHIDANHVVSVGYSQRLAYWELSPDMSSLRLMSMTAVDVADVNCFSLSRTDNLVAVGGAGIEFASLSN